MDQEEWINFKFIYLVEYWKWIIWDMLIWTMFLFASLKITVPYMNPMYQWSTNDITREWLSMYFQIDRHLSYYILNEPSHFSIPFSSICIKYSPSLRPCADLENGVTMLPYRQLLIRFVILFWVRFLVGCYQLLIYLNFPFQIWEESSIFFFFLSTFRIFLLIEKEYFG